jgi:hypothetical protein
MRWGREARPCVSLLHDWVAILSLWRRAMRCAKCRGPMCWIGFTMSDRETVFLYKREKCGRTVTKTVNVH